ncbi:hypothetical protein EUX98_g370 [Antrodiella citrinella]|uniref:WKF domain-containing protein n=1 Tax=Antrodiella citrinella TaxID=2447956 RepID=A0A4S4N478_9APHY|nr:hypothetical protein EUX98_g370 [Antrodiella citrinella]
MSADTGDSAVSFNHPRKSKKSTDAEPAIENIKDEAKSEKKRKRNTADILGEQGAVTPATKEERRKRKIRHKEGVSEEPTGDGGEGGAEEGSKAGSDGSEDVAKADVKKKRKSERVEHEEGGEAEPRKEKKKKSQEVEQNEVAAADSIPEQLKIQEKKRRKKDGVVAVAVNGEVKEKTKTKKRKHQADEADVNASETVDAKPKKSKKKRSKDSPYPDPADDATLSEQSSKALSYAYTQAVDPSSWKFNKARQNWLLRNYWSEQAIPDEYLPLVNVYLSKVQGGVRENLLKTCRDTMSSGIADIPIEKPVVTANGESGEATKDAAVASTPPVDEVKRKRAQDLLLVLASEQTS